MNFANTNALLLLLLVPLMALFLWARAAARRAALRRIGEPDLIAMLLAQVSPARRRWKAAMWLAALAGVIVALARPTWGIETERIETQGVAVIVALDVSRSMNARDVSPSRLERAKLDLRDLLAELEGNEVGIILFAGEAYLYMPLTYDMDAALVFLDDISTGAITQQGTALEKAIQRSVPAFDPRTGADNFLIIMSDGEDHEGRVIAAAQDAHDQGVTVHTIGYGTEQGEIIPEYDDAGNVIDYKVDETGTLVETRLNADILSRIAEATDGTYAAGSAQFPSILNDINQAQAGTLGEQVVTRPTERFGLFVLLALLALSVDMLLPETRREAK
jgi:Ca-activated chloride channel homolog